MKDIYIILLLILVVNLVFQTFMVAYFCQTQPKSRAAYIFSKYLSTICGSALGSAITYIVILLFQLK